MQVSLHVSNSIGTSVCCSHSIITPTTTSDRVSDGMPVEGSQDESEFSVVRQNRHQPMPI